MCVHVPQRVKLEQWQIKYNNENCAKFDLSIRVCLHCISLVRALQNKKKICERNRHTCYLQFFFLIGMEN
jgi:hypothetical protein